MGSGIRNPVMRFLVYSHLWLALGAAAQTWWMGVMMGGSPWRAPVLAFCGTIVCYAYMRWARMDHPELAASAHLKWFRENKRAMLVLAGLCAVAGTIVALPLAGELFNTFWPVAVIGVLYVVPLPLTGGRTIGLRRIPTLKAFLIATTWAWVTVALPFIIDGNLLRKDTIWSMGLMQMAFFLSLAMTFDARDLPFDRRSLRTIPQMIGWRSSRVFASLLIVPWMGYLGFLSFLIMAMGAGAVELLSIAWLWLPIMGFGLTMALSIRATPHRGEAYYSVGLDGMLILIPLLGWIGSYF